MDKGHTMVRTPGLNIAVRRLAGSRSFVEPRSCAGAGAGSCGALQIVQCQHQPPALWSARPHLEATVLETPLNGGPQRSSLEGSILVARDKAILVIPSGTQLPCSSTPLP